MMNETAQAPPVDVAGTPESAPPGTPETPASGSQEDAQPAHQTLSDVTTKLRGLEHTPATTVADFETIASAAHAAWRRAEDVQKATRDENRAFYGNFKKIVDHHGELMKQMHARFEQSEQKAQNLVLEANRLIAEHQATVDRFNKITRRIALFAFGTALVLLAMLELYWWLG